MFVNVSKNTDENEEKQHRQVHYLETQKKLNFSKNQAILSINDILEGKKYSITKPAVIPISTILLIEINM